MDELTGKQRRYLRGLSNTLQPLVYIGKEGISAEVLRVFAEASTRHELIKVRLERNCPIPRQAAGEQLAAATSSHLVQVLGHTLVLYRPDPERPRIQLPERRAP